MTWKEARQKRTQSAPILKRNWHRCPPTQERSPWRKQSLTLQHPHFFLPLEPLILIAAMINHGRTNPNQQNPFRLGSEKIWSGWRMGLSNGWVGFFRRVWSLNGWGKRRWCNCKAERREERGEALERTVGGCFLCIWVARSQSFTNQINSGILGVASSLQLAPYYHFLLFSSKNEITFFNFLTPQHFC